MISRGIFLGAAAASALCANAALAERGSDGQLNILYWQAVSTMNPYLSNGTKDIEGASLVLDALVAVRHAVEPATEGRGDTARDEVAQEEHARAVARARVDADVDLRVGVRMSCMRKETTLR